jgi:hypothetical protein
LNKSTSKFSIKFIDQINKEFELLFEEWILFSNFQ